MYIKLLKNNFKKNKYTYTILLVIITLASGVSGTSALMLGTIITSNHYFAEISKTPDIIQMTSTKESDEKLKAFAEQISSIEQYEQKEGVIIPNHILYLQEHRNESDSIMDNVFVQQSLAMDQLLNENNQIIRVNNGEVAVPISYKASHKLFINDYIYIHNKEKKLKLKIVSFVRDSVNGSSLISSKRFVVNEDIHQSLAKQYEKEYAIQFRLQDTSDIEEVKKSYQASGLSANGPMVDRTTIMVLNILSYGIQLIVLIFATVLLCMLAIIFLVFAMKSMITNETNNIASMKAIGINKILIARMYRVRYSILAGVAIVLGSLAAYSLQVGLYGTMSLQFGITKNHILNTFLLVGTQLFIYIVIMSTINIQLLSIGKISLYTIQIRRKRTRLQKKMVKGLRKIKRTHLKKYLFLIELITSGGFYFQLLCVIVLLMNVVITPLQIFGTFSDKNFIQYMGIEKSDARIDYFNTVTDDQAAAIRNDLLSDPNVTTLQFLQTKQFTFNKGSKTDIIHIQIGNHVIFPLTYIRGRAPEKPNELAISELYSRELQLTVNDGIKINEETKIIVGIYQDITYGGKTAKATFDGDARVLWTTIVFNIKKEKEQEVQKKYQAAYPFGAFTIVDQYATQTFAATIESMKLVTVSLTVFQSMLLLLLIYLFSNLQTNKNKMKDDAMHLIGISQQTLKSYKALATMATLFVASVVSTMCSYLFVQPLFKTMSKNFGASNIVFFYHPAIILLFCCLLLIPAIAWLKINERKGEQK